VCVRACVCVCQRVWINPETDIHKQYIYIDNTNWRVKHMQKTCRVGERKKEKRLTQIKDSNKRKK